MWINMFPERKPYITKRSICFLNLQARKRLTVPLSDSQEHHQGADEKHSSDHAGSYHVHLLLQERERTRV